MLHCFEGTDRTSFTLLLSLGVEYKDIVRDYAFTSFSTQGARYIKGQQIEVWRKKLEKFEGKNFA